MPRSAWIQDLDRARGFKVTESGITVLSKGQVVPEPGEAERALAAANLVMVPDAVKAATEQWSELRESVDKVAEVQAAAVGVSDAPGNVRPSPYPSACREPGTPPLGRAPCRL